MIEADANARQETPLELAITRVIDAPVELVWMAWTDAQHAQHWGPDGFVIEHAQYDLRPGGKWRAKLRATGGGRDLWQGGVFRAVVEPTRLVFTFAWDGPDGKPETETLLTLSLEDLNGKTRLTLHHAGFPSVAERDGHMGGWVEALDSLAEHVETLRPDEPGSSSFKLSTPSDREFVIERMFDAPAALVFDAWTTPEHVKQWYGCAIMEMTGCEIDLREGGRWRYVVRAADGSEHAFSGVYREIDRPRRLVYTETYEAIPGASCLVAVMFEEQEGKTRLTSTVLR